MIKYIVKSHVKLFNEIKSISGQVTSLGSIIQNNQIVDDDNIAEFEKNIENIISSLTKIAKDITTYVKLRPLDKSVTDTRAQKMCDYESLGNHYDVTIKNEITILHCEDCGHSWEDRSLVENQKCPECGSFEVFRTEDDDEYNI